MTDLTTMRNIGAEMSRKLKAVGIGSAGALRDFGDYLNGKGGPKP